MGHLQFQSHSQWLSYQYYYTLDTYFYISSLCINTYSKCKWNRWWVSVKSQVKKKRQAPSTGLSTRAQAIYPSWTYLCPVVKSRLLRELLFENLPRAVLLCQFYLFYLFYSELSKQLFFGVPYFQTNSITWLYSALF